MDAFDQVNRVFLIILIADWLGLGVWGGFCIESLVPSVCVPEGAKKEHSKDHKSSTTF